MMEGLLPGKLRMARAEKGLTLREAAARTGVAKETLSELERGKRLAQPGTLFKIAQGYGISVRDLMEEPVPLAEAPQEDEAGPPADAESLAAVCGDLSRELQHVRETPAEDLKAERIAELHQLRVEAETALSRAINGQSWTLDELSLQAVLRQRRRKAQHSRDDAASEAG